jgi:UDP-N-acetylglucosamine 2-epimerase (non-hydrolysing)
MHVLHVLGARSNARKAAPVTAVLERRRIRQTIVHAGLRESSCLTPAFFAELGMRAPDVHLGVESGTQAWQTAEVMSRLEPLLLKQEPDVVLVYGDVSSTVAAALACSKLGIRVGHVEAGHRSFDRRAVDELNRIVTDQVADLLFTTSADADENLAREAIPADRVHRVGSLTIDLLVRLLPQAAPRRHATSYAGLNGHPYLVLTLNRTLNTEDDDRLIEILNACSSLAALAPVVVVAQPKALLRIRSFGTPLHPDVRLVEPLGVVDFLALESRALAVITDSRAVQDETTFLGVPCFTVLPQTDRPATVTIGNNTLVEHPAQLEGEVLRVLGGHGKAGSIPPLWDGCAAERLAETILA